MLEKGTKVLCLILVSLWLAAPASGAGGNRLEISCQSHFYHGNIITSGRYTLSGYLKKGPDGRYEGEVTTQDDTGEHGPYHIRQLSWDLNDPTGAHGYAMQYDTEAVSRKTLILWEGREGHHVHSAQNALCLFVDQNDEQSAR